MEMATQVQTAGTHRHTRPEVMSPVRNFLVFTLRLSFVSYRVERTQHRAKTKKKKTFVLIPLLYVLSYF